MRKFVIAIVFFGVSSLSAMTESFETAFASFIRSSSVNACYNVASIESLVDQIKPSEIPYNVYVEFSYFLLDESLKSYELSYIAKHRVEVLKNIILKNLMQICRYDVCTKSAMADLCHQVEKLYRVMVTGFCVCLMNAMDKQRVLSQLVPKL
ncbi:MAG: hypothetical protein WCS92_03035 [Candidatus Babeliales bacterium]|jgi:hypothetical protein